MYFTSNDGCEIMFIYQPTYKPLYTPLYATFLNSTKFSGYRKGIKLNNSILVVEQNNDTTLVEML